MKRLLSIFALTLASFAGAACGDDHPHSHGEGDHDHDHGEGDHDHGEGDHAHGDDHDDLPPPAEPE